MPEAKCICGRVTIACSWVRFAQYNELILLLVKVKFLKQMDAMIGYESVGKQSEVLCLEQLYISHVILTNLFETFYTYLAAKIFRKVALVELFVA